MHRYEELIDYRRRVSEIYSRVRSSSLDTVATWRQYCREKDELFATHAQSPLTADQRRDFVGLHYYPHNESYRYKIVVAEGDEAISEVALQDDGIVQMSRFGKISMGVDGHEVSLSLFWILGYGGGLFLPFRDATSAQETYGGGRYLLDTIKHADLGRRDSGLIIDFNYSYNPSCAYNPRWSCPLSPRENTLVVPISPGEMDFVTYDPLEGAR